MLCIRSLCNASLVLLKKKKQRLIPRTASLGVFVSKNCVYFEEGTELLHVIQLKFWLQSVATVNKQGKSSLLSVHEMLFPI